MSDSKAQVSLIEAAMKVRLGETQEETPETQEEVVEETTETTETEELVYEYLSSFFGADLNESIDELTEEHLEEAIVAINTLADAVNEYFELDEALGDDAERRRREDADIAAYRKKGDEKGAARIIAARKAGNMPMGQAKQFIRRAVDNA